MKKETSSSENYEMERVSFWIKKATLDKIVVEAKNRKRKKSDMIRVILEEAFE